MAASDFSWTKIICFFGAGLAVFFAFVNFGSAGLLIQGHNTFNGVITLLSAIGWLAVAYGCYKVYQNYDAIVAAKEAIEKEKEKKAKEQQKK